VIPLRPSTFCNWLLSRRRVLIVVIPLRPSICFRPLSQRLMLFVCPPITSLANFSTFSSSSDLITSCFGFETCCDDYCYLAFEACGDDCCYLAFETCGDYFSLAASSYTAGLRVEHKIYFSMTPFISLKVCYCFLISFSLKLLA